MKRTIQFTIIAIIVIGTLLAAGCRKKKKEEGFDRTAMLSNYADNYILPAYTDVLLKLNDMQTSIDDFIAHTDTAKLVAVRKAWKATYISWQSAELVAFGPGEASGLRNFMNSYPTSITKIDNNIATNTYELETLDSKDAQGLPAMDYLLNGYALHDTAIIRYYTTDAKAAARKQYMKAIAQKMTIRLVSTLDDWNVYRSIFIKNTATDTGGSISLLVNGYVNYYDKYLCLAKVGKPAGVINNMIAPTQAEAYYLPTLTNLLAITSLRNANMFFEGYGYGSVTGSDHSLKGYLISTGKTNVAGQSMAYVISTRLAEADSSLAKIVLPIQETVVSNRPLVLGAYNTMQAVTPLFKTDMATAFGITVK